VSEKKTQTCQEKHPIGTEISGKGLRDKSLDIFGQFIRIQENAINSIKNDDVSIISRATLYCIALEIIEEKKEVRK